MSAALDSVAALHLETALRNHRAKVERNGGAVPDQVRFLEALARFRVSAGQDGSPFGDPADAPDDAGVTPRLLTYRQAADALAISESSVKRLVSSGELTAVHIGGAARVRLADLDAYVAGLACPSSVAHVERVSA
jgi:excisionase family DNA binding protein